MKHMKSYDGGVSMKRIALSLLCCMMLLGGCSSSKQGEIKHITISELVDKMKNKDSFVLIVSREGCDHCQKLKMMLKGTLSDHNTIIYNVDMDESSYEALIGDIKKLEKYVSKPGSTPHIYYIKDGKENDQYIGFDENHPSEFWEFIENNGLENAK